MTIPATAEMTITPVAQAVQIENQDLIGKFNRIKLITEVKLFIIGKLELFDEQMELQRSWNDGS